MVIGRSKKSYRNVGPVVRVQLAFRWFTMRIGGPVIIVLGIGWGLGWW